MADCADCGKSVLTYVALDDDKAPNAASACIAIRRSPKVSSGCRPASSSRRAIISVRRRRKARRAVAAAAAAVAASRSPERAGLAQRFIHDDRYRVRKIQAAHARLEDWYAIGPIGSLRQEFFAKA